MNITKTAFKLFLTLTIMTGLIYPLLVTLIAELTMPYQAGGSLISVDQKVVGSALIAQSFKGEGYFWPRPSAIDYDPVKPSGGSNLGPISKKLQAQVEERAKVWHQPASVIPSELVYASGSGLDPHISLKAAYFQVDRIAKARSIQDQSQIKKMIDDSAPGFGGRYVNVLLLNLSLDKQFSKAKS